MNTEYNTDNEQVQETDSVIVNPYELTLNKPEKASDLFNKLKQEQERGKFD